MVSESREQSTGNLPNESCWVYKWFPVYLKAYNNNVLVPFRDYNDDQMQYEAQIYALDWVKRRYESYKPNLPTYFKVPNSYTSDQYCYLQDFEKKNKDYNLSYDELSVAMFIHRGIFYLSHTFKHHGSSYLPHSNRASFLTDDELSLQSYLIANNDDRKKIYGVSAGNIQKKIEKIIETKRKESIGTSPFTLNGIGGAFIHKYGISNAFEEALSFRETAKGEEVRKLFRNLVYAGSNSDNVSITVILKQLSKEIDSMIKSKLGGDIIDQIQFSELPFWSKYLASFIPQKLSKTLVKGTNIVVRPTGFQMIFDQYI